MAEPRAAERIEYIVEGGHRLSGSIEPSGNKNAALPIIAAALLTDQPVELTNVPRIRDVEALVRLLASLGAETEWTGHNALRIHARDIQPATLDPDLCSRIRASILLAGPVLARCGQITLPPPGGDVIGRRRLDSHFLALRQLGAEITLDGDYVFKAKALTGADVFLDEPSVTATENALCAAVAASGTTILRNCASEPHVQDLAHFLNAMGARIDGIGTNCMTIEGGRPLGSASHRIGPDHIEVGSLIGLAAVTDSDLRITNAGVEHLRSTLMGFERLGIHCRIEGDDLIVPSGQSKRIEPDFGGHVPKIEDQPGRPSRRHHVDRDRYCHPMRGHGADVRKDVRIADVLRRQADRHGRPDRAVRSAPGGDFRPLTSEGGAPGKPGYSRRHGHADCRHGGGWHLDHQQCPADRARLRADR